MPDRKLYTIAIPADIQTRSRPQTQRQLSKSGVVAGGNAQAEAVSLDPNEVRIEGTIRDFQFGQLRATELEELFGAPDISTVPYYVVDERHPRDGYYALEQVVPEPPAPQEENIQRVDGRLTRRGSHSSHWRAAETTIDPVENDFGTTQEARIGIPTAAAKVRWFDPATKQRDSATPVTSTTGEFGTVDVFDAEAAPYEDPVLLYEIAYADDPRADVMVWDDRGHGSRDDGSGAPQWQKVFQRDHEYQGERVVSNKLLRLTFDESANTLSAEQWNDTSDTWGSVALGTSDWELFDADLTFIGLARVEGQIEFRNPATSPTSYYALDMSLASGATAARWTRPPNESDPTPSGLVTLLDPIADGTILDPQSTRSIVERTEVQK
ncbi:hypothetical protein BRC81_02945 [Halobacteriales archaeon QS_1_68_20]|nr:MAG: hypothetical protein BRC81_02945 [Halobacteriales archaeon QS_1_68_20]